ncbi:MAG: Cytochrome c family protein, partial [Dehalococcoidia bacterium]|nr:Cytochrome c family protein [Dehalococcoidia bacterium]
GAQKDTTKGSQLYTANCQSCHGGASGGQVMDIPPPHNANGHTWHHSDCQIKEIVVNGSGEMEEMMRRVMGSSESTPQMPAFKETLSDEEIDTILYYIKSWWKPEQREFQAEVTRAQC